MSIFRVGEESALWADKIAKLDHWYQASTTSTNLIAKDSAFIEDLDESPIALYFTDHQSAGKGRGSNRWLNAKDGNSFLSSWSFAISEPPAITITCVIGLAVFRALQATWPQLQISLKAPNDIFLNNKKLGGLLVETVSQGSKHRLVVGLGLNVFSYPSVFDEATCIINALPPNYTLSREVWFSFLDRLLLEFSLGLHLRGQFSQNDKLAFLHALNLRANKDTQYLDMDEAGNLITSTGTISWSSL